MSDACEICHGGLYNGVVHVFGSEPFIDGKYYDTICWTCASVPKSTAYNGVIIVLSNLTDTLHSVQEMQEDGWSKDEALKSIKAISKLLDRRTIMPAGGVHIFNKLYVDISIII